MELELDVSATGFLPTRAHVRKGQAEAKVALDPGVIVSGRALDGKGHPQMGVVSVSCGKGREHPGDPSTSRAGSELQGFAGGLCSATLTVISTPIQSFENTRYFSVAGKEPVSLEFQFPAVRHPIHLRFQGDGTARRALLFAEDLP